MIDYAILYYTILYYTRFYYAMAYSTIFNYIVLTLCCVIGPGAAGLAGLAQPRGVRRTRLALVREEYT